MRDVQDSSGKTTLIILCAMFVTLQLTTVPLLLNQVFLLIYICRNLFSQSVMNNLLVQLKTVAIASERITGVQ